MFKNPLLDKDFLKELDKTSLKEVYAEVIALNSDDEPLETIEGYITQGTITIDGSSSVRRTCSLSIVADELNIHEFYWGLHTKFKLSVGMKNTINSNYPDIIWFPQGIFVISNFNTSQNLSNYTIQVQGKDKMSMLNGELGGTITSLTHNFGEYLYTDNQGYTYSKKTLIREIIMDAVHQFANEPLYNIIINDLDDVGLELMEYRGEEPFYIIINEKTQEVENITLNGDTKYYNGTELIAIKSIPEYNPLFDLEQSGIVVDYTIVNAAINDGIPLSVAKLEYGMTAGYRITDLVYAGDLILNVGETITSLLDKIVSMLGEFEYFYDIDGRFIFQRKKTYISTQWNNIINNVDEQYIENAVYTSAVSYSFEDGTMVASYSNNPNFANLRNDFSIWGTRKSVSGSQLPVHMRYAIDKKPVMYVTYDRVGYTSLSKDEFLNFIPKDSIAPKDIKANLDWRELIYQMAIDYRKNNMKDDFYNTIRKNNYDIYTNGKTKYEQYYVDMEGFWRQLYNPEYKWSYQSVFLTKEGYESKLNAYYFSIPKYKQCVPGDPYRLGIIYYSYQYDKMKDADTLQEAIGLTKYDYYGNESNYYFITADDPYEIISCIIIEPYRKSGYGYYDENHRPIERVVSKDEYNGNEQNYYFVNSETFKPCVSVEKYNSSIAYYTKNSDDYQLAKGLTEENYNSKPGIYYYKHYTYTQCSENSLYDSSKTYYAQGANSVSDETIYVPIKVLNSEIYNKNPTMYFLRDENPTYINCIKKLEEYNSTYEYFERNEEALDNNTTQINYKPIQVNNIANYNEIILSGKVYYKKKQFLCCKHPVVYSSLINFYEKVKDEFNKDGWVKDVSRNPESLNFWFDFLDENSELQKYGCYAIGNRPKAVNDNQVKAIYFRETPTVIFINNDDWETADKSKLGYTYLRLPQSMENLFSISSQGKSAKTVLDEYLYKYACNAESIMISILPIYHLEPNTRIFVHNEESGINGEYILTRYSITLGNGNNMSINATKAVDRLY